MNYAAGLFARCPTCLNNLNQHICLMTCSPNQTDFLEAVDILTNFEGSEFHHMISITLFLKMLSFVLLFSGDNVMNCLWHWRTKTYSKLNLTTSLSLFSWSIYTCPNECILYYAFTSFSHYGWFYSLRSSPKSYLLIHSKNYTIPS